jgi:hypothetical protein
LSDGDGSRTEEELLAEIEALKAELERRSRDTDKRVPEGSAAPVFSVPITRRASLVSWVAPVILSLPVVQGVGMLLGSGTAHAAPVPTKAGRCIVSPTASPTTAPTAKPTAKPTIAVPTTAKKSLPTFKPTAAPTVAPTLGMAAAPDSRPSPVGLMALGSARAACRGQIGV